MRVVFMGTPDFAVPSLDMLCQRGHQVLAAFTREDKKVGRGMKIQYSPVKQRALELGIPLYQPATLKSDEICELLRGLAPDCIVVVAYGLILPQRILDIPPYGCINIHGSLLPKYRGSAPVQWSVLKGENETGVTAMYMAAGLDSGDMIDSLAVEIGENEDAAALYHRLSFLGADLLKTTMEKLAAGAAHRTPQNEELVTWAPPLTREQSAMDFTNTVHTLACQVRGLQPWPVAKAELGGNSYKIFAVTEGDTTDQAPGTLLGCDRLGIHVACADRELIITELQAQGGKRMRAADYLRGHTI